MLEKPRGSFSAVAAVGRAGAGGHRGRLRGACEAGARRGREEGAGARAVPAGGSGGGGAETRRGPGTDPQRYLLATAPRPAGAAALRGGSPGGSQPGEGGHSPGGVTALGGCGGVSQPGGVTALGGLRGGVTARGGGVTARGGVTAQGGVTVRGGGMCVSRGVSQPCGGLRAHSEHQEVRGTPLHACPTLSF